jgi:hypothetical protein
VTDLRRDANAEHASQEHIAERNEQDQLERTLHSKRSGQTPDRATGKTGARRRGVDYGSINKHGQRSGVRALLDRSNLGGRTKPRPSEPIPSYVPGQDNRTHLLGAFIGGSNIDPRNFVAMFRSANNPEMLSYEYQIRGALEIGQQVDFSATPLYSGTDSRPLGIEIRAIGSGPDPLMLHETVWNRRY